MPEGLSCAEGFDGIAQQHMARQSATAEGPVRAVNDFLSSLVLEAPAGKAAELGLHMSVVTESARAHSFYSVRRYCNSSFTTLAVQIWLYQCVYGCV